ncbi:MAG: hypothetical protein K2M31_02450 [Muribaculaceae bacterium]|nr:hypothetical protein [Muribaculaceae bacterium]
MRKISLHTFLPVAVRKIGAAMLAAGLIALASCSGKSQKSAETIRVEPSQQTELPKKAVSDAQLTPLGVDPIRTGMRISEIQPKIENLYDSISRQGGYESNCYYFYLNGNQRFTVYEFDSGIVNVVSVDNRSIVVNGSGGKELRLGDSFKKVLSLKDVNAVWQAGDGDGMWCWNWQGIWFYPDQENLPDVLAHKLYNQTSAPQASDFNDDIEIGYMGTGLPW